MDTHSDSPRCAITWAPFLAATFAAAVLGACSSNGSPNSAGIPQPLRASRLVIGRQAPDIATRGIDVAVNNAAGAGAVYGYPADNRDNHGYSCFKPGFNFLWDVSTDVHGNLIVPDALFGVYVEKGPQLCGPTLGHITGYSYQQAIDAAAVDAAHARIAVAYHYGRFQSDPGGIAVCSLAAGCAHYLTNPGVFEVFSDTMARNGDCWADGWPPSSTTPNLVYYAHCKGRGQIATGFANSFAGGLDVDNDGHLLAISSPAFTSKSGDSQLYVYSGCRPRCTLIGGPFSLAPPTDRNTGSEYGHLNAQNDRFVTANAQYNQVDVFAYTGHGTGLNYLYSFNKGFGYNAVPIGATYVPGSQR